MVRICRTCLGVIEDSLYYAVDAIDSTTEPITRQEKIRFCVPEMVINIVQNHVICQSCYDALKTAYNFRQRCLETERVLHDYLINNKLTKANKYIDLKDVVRNSTQSNMQETNEAMKRIVLEEIDVIIKYAHDGAGFGAVFSHFMAEIDNDKRYKETTSTDDVNVLLSRIPECVVEVKNSSNDFSNNFYESLDDKGKAWTCDVCQRAFRAKDKLTRHKRIHTGEKPYKCSSCDKQFSRKDKLFVHERTHTGEKPFMCDVCNKMFSRKDKLRAHLKTHNKTLHMFNVQTVCT